MHNTLIDRRCWTDEHQPKDKLIPWFCAISFLSLGYVLSMFLNFGHFSVSRSNKKKFLIKRVYMTGRGLIEWKLLRKMARFPKACLSLVHTNGGDGSTKFHTNPIKRRRNRRKKTLPFSSVPSPFYRVCIELCASVSVASVNQALEHEYYSLPKLVNANLTQWQKTVAKWR